MNKHQSDGVTPEFRLKSDKKPKKQNCNTDDSGTHPECPNLTEMHREQVTPTGSANSMSHINLI